MILTETLFRKIISFAVGKETQLHTDRMVQASAVLKQAHKRGVELEYILEVRPLCNIFLTAKWSPLGSLVQKYTFLWFAVAVFPLYSGHIIL